MRELLSPQSGSRGDEDLMRGLAVDAARGDEDLVRGLAVDGARGGGGHVTTDCSMELVLKV